MASRLNIGDEVCLRGIVRQIDLAGTNTVTIELRSTGHMVTVSADSAFVEIVNKAKGGGGKVG